MGREVLRRVLLQVWVVEGVMGEVQEVGIMELLVASVTGGCCYQWGN